MRALHNAIRVLALVLVAVLASVPGDAIAQEAAGSGFRTVSFDDAMKGQLVRSIPLKLAFPVEYESLTRDAGINGVIWSRRADLDHIARTGESPPGAGLFHGRLTTRIGYDRASNAFVCGPGCGEKDMLADIRAAGADNVRSQKLVVNGIPMLLLEMGTANMQGAVRKRLYMAYVAVLIDTNVFLISYSPPLDSKDEGRTVWQAFTRALTGGVVTAEPAQARDQAQPSSFADDLAQAARSAEFRPVADAFVAALVAGDAAKGMGLISPNLLNAAGRDVVEGSLSGQVLPFFAPFKGIGRSETIARTSDEFGSDGFVFYLSMTPKQGEARPFAVYVVEENGVKVIANILLDHDPSKVTAR